VLKSFLSTFLVEKDLESLFFLLRIGAYVSSGSFLSALLLHSIGVVILVRSTR